VGRCCLCGRRRARPAANAEHPSAANVTPLKPRRSSGRLFHPTPDICLGDRRDPRARQRRLLFSADDLTVSRDHTPQVVVTASSPTRPRKVDTPRRPC
jgi:hypothetical protein